MCSDVNILHERERNHPYTVLYKHAGGRRKHVFLRRTPWKSRAKHFGERGLGLQFLIHVTVSWVETIPPAGCLCLCHTTTTTTTREEEKRVSTLLTWCRPSVRKNTAVSFGRRQVTQIPCL